MAVAVVLKNENSEKIIHEIMQAYRIDCTNLHCVYAEKLNDFMEAYKNSGSLSVLHELISLARCMELRSSCVQNDLVKEICCYIVENLECDCSAKSLAGRFHFSAHYIRHIFKKETGTSIVGYKNEQRMKQARLLLLAGNSKIAEVAVLCGYNSPGYFTELFSREVGLSPKAYKQKMRDGNDGKGNFGRNTDAIGCER